MRRNPLYAFKGRESVGIYEVPMNSTIHILDGGDGLPIFVEIVGKIGLTNGSTIGQFLDDETLYVDLSGAEISLSELEKMVEGTHTGWRLLGSNPDNHGDVGNHGIDLSESTTASATKGATGANSLASGKNTTASGNTSVALGLGTESSGLGTVSVGRYNDNSTAGGYQSEKILVVGVGNEDYDRQNGLIVYADGIVEAPEMDILEVQSGSDKVLVTKEYSDDVDGGNI